MNLLLPITTIILIFLGTFCLFLAMDNDRRMRARFAQRNSPQTEVQFQFHRSRAFWRKSDELLGEFNDKSKLPEKDIR